VKINGRRVELGPIELAISRAMHPIVSRTAVLLLLPARRLHAFCQTVVCGGDSGGGSAADTGTDGGAAWEAVHASGVCVLGSHTLHASPLALACVLPCCRAH
jgi:hypothetical protein